MRGIGGMSLGIVGLVFAGSAVLFGSTLVNAVRVQEVPAQPGPASISEEEGAASLKDAGVSPESGGPEAVGQLAGTPQGVLPGVIYPRVTNDEILGAVNQDLFQPDRTPSVDRYLLPSERPDPVQNSRSDRRQREPTLRVVGTAISGGLALAVVQLEDSIPFAVLLGEEVDGYLLASVTGDNVTLTRDGSEFNFQVVEPDRGRSSNNQDRNSRNNRNNASTQEAAQALAERVQQMLQQGMGRGQMIRGTTFETAPVVIQRPGGGQVPVRILRPGGGGGGSRP